MHRHVVPALLLVSGIGLLAGCGQKGPLTLPPPKPTVATPAPATSAHPPVPAASVAVPMAARSG